MSRPPVLDRCPAVLRPHEAADGLMVRLRLPGGRIEASVLAGLGTLARAHGNPNLYLTSRCGIQLRGLPDPLPIGLVDALSDLGLLPSHTHEQARTIIASPLTGIRGGVVDISSMITELDAAIVAAPPLAQLSGRFLFVIDDGSHSVLDQPFDLAYRAESADQGWILAGAGIRGVRVSRQRAVSTMIELACSFVARRPDAGIWHVRDLPEWMADIGEPLEVQPISRTEVPLGDVNGAASIMVPLSAVDPDQLAVVTAVGRELRLTPDRGLVIPGAAGSLPELVACGLIADRGSAWSMVSACVGAPFCSRAVVDTRTWAHHLVDRDAVTARTHLSGCARRCGAPRRDHVDLVHP